MSYNLFLDDERRPQDLQWIVGPLDVLQEDFVCVKSFNEFYSAIKKYGIPKLVCFDYKILGDKTGLDCAEFLKFECDEQGVDVPEYIVHSGWPGIKGNFHEILDK
ncbi:MAG TPA: hypothetical protein P5509_05005 [Bacteroidales bacterium]|nr:hypothetical protein [Bacteroidales bacterium]